MNELVSVIIPVRNRPELLRQAVDSVIAQTYRPLQIIVVDDGSTDNTLSVAEGLVKMHPALIFVVRQEESLGPGPARERGRQIAEGEYIQYLDSDDLLLPRKLEWQVNGLRERPECGVSYGKTVYTKQGAPYEEEAWKRTGEGIETMFPSFIMDRWWGTSTPLYRRSLTDAAGPWKAIGNEQDWEYDCRIAALGVRLHYCDEFVSHERAHDGIRQCTDAAKDPEKLAGRAMARHHIWQSAVRADLDHAAPEVQHFARYAFLLARQCGIVGLSKESRELFELSRESSTVDRARGWDFVLYRIAANMLGWRSAARLSYLMDRWR